MEQYEKFKPNPGFRSFIEAREFARALGLRSTEEWHEYAVGRLSKLPERPPDIPSHPALTYSYQGWSGFPDFLGYPSRWKYRRKYRQFTDARIFVRSLRLSKLLEWRQYCQGQIFNRGIKPKDIPASPNRVYREWISWPDFLGNRMVEHEGKLYEPFKDARAFVRSLRLKNLEQWFAYCNGKAFCKLPARPDGIPVFPYIVYKNHGWRSWPDWFGASRTGGKHLSKYIDFKDARALVRELKLKSHKEWLKYCRGEMIACVPRPDDIPFNPDVVFKGKGWISWGDYLGTRNISSARYVARPFEQARTYVRKLCFKNEAQWRQYCKGELPDLPPKNIPTNPHRTYRDKWQGMGDWLGTGNIANFNKEFRAFEQARQFVHKLKLKNVKQWRVYCQGKFPDKGSKPADIPANPEGAYYNKGWISYGDWLGTGSIHPGKIRHMSYEKARYFVRSIGIESCIEWRKYVGGYMPHLPPKPPGIPSNLERHFKGKWVSWKSFLGTEKSDIA